MAISDTPPPQSYPRGGKTVFSFNVVSGQVTDPQTGKTKTQYSYDEAEVSGNVTRAKVVAAMQRAALEKDAADPSTATTKFADATDALNLSGIANLTYDQLDTYIQNNVTTLATAQAFLKKLAKVTLALVKLQNLG